MSLAVSSRRRAPRGGGPAARPAQRSPLARVAAARWPYRLLTLVVVGGVWEAYARVFGGLLIPTFTGTVTGVVELLLDPEVYRAFLVSNQALVAGFAISVVVGIPAGLVMARFAVAERIVDPYVTILLITPLAPLIPLLFMSLGLGLASRVVLVVAFALPMVIVNSRAGFRQVDPSLIEMARNFGATERQVWRRILLPGALPAVMTGIRIGLARAVTAMVVVELLMVSVGIGNLILEFRGFFESQKLYATVILVIFEALLLVTLMRWIERRVSPWAQTARLSNELGATRR